MSGHRGLVFEISTGKGEVFFMNCKTLLFLLPVAVLSLVSPQVTMAEEVTLAQCPAPVQAAIQKNAQGGSLEEIKLVNKGDGDLYVAELSLGEKLDLKLYVK